MRIIIDTDNLSCLLKIDRCELWGFAQRYTIKLHPAACCLVQLEIQFALVFILLTIEADNTFTAFIGNIGIPIIDFLLL